ncbi:MAG: hypothetical protein ACRC91_14820, partial [Aeromonas sp.]
SPTLSGVQAQFVQNCPLYGERGARLQLSDGNNFAFAHLFSSERRFIAHLSPKNSPPLRAATQFDQPNGD